MTVYRRPQRSSAGFSRVLRQSIPTREETVAPSEEAQLTPGPWTGFEPVRLETPRTPKHAWFHCTTAAPVENSEACGVRSSFVVKGRLVFLIIFV
ncbi:hypothetical protein E2C01_047090 [Portunus trituberculatus]|uniref:Uncharacterized protein n=1 Tax=Portunus trituberculatus TaxID=210409 RepID=A0A5B7G2P6_PORTR|nr:hypothetical protein [Portunus trituberculatus]